MTDKTDFFVPENAKTECRQEHLSPSGKYKLVTTPYATSPGCWSYSQGLVYMVGDESTPIAEVQRNYSSFNHTFIEDHPNGHAYLICGEDYQGQTVIELDTGRRRDFLPEAAAQGHGFCWVTHKFDPGTNILTVAGCIWACPYEFRFYDFSDPMDSGWPWLETDDGEHIYDDEDRPPTFEPDGVIKVYQTALPPESDEDFEAEAAELGEEGIRPVASIKTYKREGAVLKFLDEWVSDEEREIRRKRAEYEAAYKVKMAAYKANDPLYLKHKELCADPAMSPEESIWFGLTHKDWCPPERWEGREQRAIRRIVKTDLYTVNLEWATETGPIRVVVHKDGKHDHDQWFDHSAEGMVAAFEHAKTFSLA